MAEVWAYYAANQIEIVGDVVTRYWNNMIIRLIQGGGVKYFLVTKSELVGANTVLTIYGGGVYTLTSDPITVYDNDLSRSYVAAPRELPANFNRAGILAEIVTDAVRLALLDNGGTPETGYMNVYFKADGKLYKKNSAGVESEVGIVDEVSTTAAGLCPMLPDDSGQFLNGVGEWASPGESSASAWTAETNFTATPASTSTLTMTADKTATIKKGMGLKYTIGGVVYYGIVTAIAANLLTIAGAPMGGDVTALYWCDPSRVVQVDFFVSGKFADAANTGLLASDANTAFDWNLGRAYCVLIRHKVKTDDTGANQSRVTISIAGSVVGTDNTNAGQAVAETWTSTVVGINTTNYDINPDEAIEVVTDANGTNDDAANLTVSAVFVLE